MKIKHRTHLEQIFRAGLEAVDPEEAVRKHVRLQENRLQVGEHFYDLSRFERVLLVGAGKGTAPMAKALEEILGERFAGGRIVVKYGHGSDLKKTYVLEAGHPIPDEAGLEGAEKILEFLRESTEKDLVLCAFSGGGSALLPAPVLSVSLSQKQETTRLLLESGAVIDEINAIRKHLSRIKGGGLARAAYPATIISLLLSDVVGDRPDVIASGPTAPDTSTYRDCLQIIERYGLKETLPPPVRERMEKGAGNLLPETPKAGDPLFGRVRNLIVGSNRTALLAARKQALSLGYNTLLLSSQLQGEAREAARVLAAVAKEVSDSHFPAAPPACILAGGETTVTLRGNGKGGRNQELALAAAIALDGREAISLLSAGTDGTDGPTDAAGAYADGSTCERARRLKIDPRACLIRNDSYTFFNRLDDLLKTGPTRTNVMDMICLLID